MATKRFGYHMDHLHFHVKNSRKMNYLRHKDYGQFSTPKSHNGACVQELINNHKHKLDYEKYLNPKGLKPTITNNFPKMGTEHDFVSHQMLLYKSFKPYKRNVASFRCSPFMTKPEIKQYLMKIYGLNVIKVHTVNKQGRIVKNHQNNTRWRKKDWKKAIVEFDFDVEPSLAKHDL
ncbi:unnamed protein product [Moneuplotes crassus]|uniref:Large ribosomal subunit protein uL23m n=2 Tax=Euplotes crassus TaxID=5936 RepID=A0AAD2D6X4_EUPCR|nr:unnamed protein product [Moneuplotes crassus]|eukprot:CAMPEP_0197000720 /NCGR_PEP_ID=MMETSP1380-20130617/5595_1 /TAXON_ID=5936 /ORGANISM="Euplotes crassus, Strain CT5" /LENGTH=175 /DNA_ID=CAMNT_0042418119 /DNA_START=19 /DNA_END=546 /DNA_ORIENTATION=-